MPSFTLYNLVSGIADCASPFKQIPYKSEVVFQLKLAKRRACFQQISEEQAFRLNFKERMVARLLVAVVSVLSLSSTMLYCMKPHAYFELFLLAAFSPSLILLMALGLSRYFDRTDYLAGGTGGKSESNGGELS